MGPYKHKRPKKKEGEHWTGMHTPPRTAAHELGDVDFRAELRQRGQAIADAKTDKERDRAINRFRSSMASFEKMKERSPIGKKIDYTARVTRKRGGKVSRKRGGKIMYGYKTGGKV